MALVEILGVSLCPLNDEQLLGCYIDAPVSGSQAEIYAVNVAGWVVGRNSPAIAVELVHREAVIWRIPINIHRSDIAALYPDVSKADTSGFQIMISVLRLPNEFELLVRVVLSDERRIPVGVIRARRSSPSFDFQPKLHPLMVSTLGRSGSTWLMQLLGQHPRIIAYQPFKNEPRVASYWMEILNTLSNPASYLQPINGGDISGNYWWIGDGPSLASSTVVDPQIYQRLGRSHIEALASFCQNRIEAFYEHVAIIQDQPNAVYFAEKYIPGYFVPAMIWQLYAQAREIFLVRDFRDVLCSIFAYKKKNAHTNFFSGRADSDQEHIRELRNDLLIMLQSWRQRSDKAYLLRYEDLIWQPEETLKSMVDYLNLDSDLVIVRRMLQEATNMTPEAQRQHQTSSDPLASIGRWRHDLSPSLQALCQDAFGDVLEEFGYRVE